MVDFPLVPPPEAEDETEAPGTMRAAKRSVGLTRRQAIQAAATTLAGVAGRAALSQQPGSAAQPRGGAKPAEKLRIATCQFPVGASPAKNAEYIRDSQADEETRRRDHDLGDAQQTPAPARRPG